MSDAQLLDDFVTRQDEASFEVLVWRHGSMVLSVCQRVLHDSHEAEDAFQATFLVFARKAGSVGKSEALGSWLYKVAFRVALRLRARLAQRGGRDEPVDDLPAREVADEVLWRDLRPVLDEEIDRLPEKYRAPFVLCHLEGHTNEEAAELLGCPKGTILSRLARGRERLRDRLTRRGLALSAGALTLALSQNAAAAVPAVLVSSTVEAAILFAAGKAAAGLVSATVAALTEGVLHTMFLTKLKFATAALLALAMLRTGVGVVSYRSLAGAADQGRTADRVRTAERNPDQEPREYAAAAEGERGVREGRKPADISGKITAIDGMTLSLEGGAARGEEPKKFTVKMTDKTKVEFPGLLQDIAKKLKVGDTVAVWYQEGSKDMAASVQANRAPDVTGKIKSADGTTLIVEIPGPGRGEVTKAAIMLTDKTKVASGARGGEAETKLQVGYVASVWLLEGSSKEVAAAIQVNRPRPDVGGTISALSADGKVLTVAVRSRGGEDSKTEVRLADATKIEFTGGEETAKKIKVGQTITVWWQEGSTDTAGTVLINLQRRGPDVTGTLSAISADGKTITLENRKRGEDTVTTTEIKLTAKTELEFAGTDKAEEKKLTVGYHVAIWLQEGSKDTAAVVRAQKPASRER